MIPEPNMRKLPFYENKWFWIIIGVVFWGSVILSEFGTHKTPPQPPNQQQGRVEAKVEQELHKIGDKITFDDSEWMVVSAKMLGHRAKSNNQFQKDAVTEGKFILVGFKVRNLTNREDRIFDVPKLVDSQGREFGNYDEENFYIPRDSKTITIEALPSNITKQFYALYEVAADSRELKFQVRALSAFGDKVPVQLGF
jgi:hypothetical protein